MQEQIYYDELKFEHWNIFIAATEKGLAYVSANNYTISDVEQWQKKRIPKSILIKNQKKITPYANQLIAYFKGELTKFTGDLDLRGTDFQKQVWNELSKIEYGKTKSYSDIATGIDNIKAIRAVGGAIGANPITIIIPCHRVIGKNGALTGFAGGLDMKVELLTLEEQRYEKGSLI